MRFASLAIALGFLASGLALRPALAATSTASFAVTATVLSSCQASAPVAAFGSDPTARRSPVSVTCNLPSPYNVSLSAALSARVAAEMSGSGKILLNNALLSYSAHTLGRVRRAGTETTAGMGSGSSQAQAFSSQTVQERHVSSGAFADAITVTITY